VNMGGGNPSLTPQWPNSIKAGSDASLTCAYVSDVGSRIYYLDPQNHVIELALDGQGSNYKDTGRIAKAGSPLTCLYISDVGSRVYYIVGNDAVTELAL
jgi:hypothetical protein